MPPEAQFSTPTDTTIVITRSFRAPRRLVWEAMFSPDKMRRWMLPPPGWTLTVCEVDPRVAGALRLAWKSADGDPFMTLEGVFTESDPHARMVHTELMKLGTGQVVGSQVEAHEFTERGGVTTMRVTQTYVSKEDRDGALTSGVQGIDACYQELDKLFAG